MTQPLLARALIRLHGDLEAIGVPWCLIGGLAVSARAEPRTTRDVDAVVAVSDDAAAEGVVRAMINRGYRIDTVLEHETAARLATVRLRMSASFPDVLADLLFASSGIEAEVARAAELYEVLPDLVVPLARTGHLLALKTLALRPDRPHERAQDFTDVRELLRVATDEELALARQAVKLIAERGYAREKDLPAALEEQIRLFEEGAEEGPFRPRTLEP